MHLKELKLHHSEIVSDSTDPKTNFKNLHENLVQKLSNAARDLKISKITKEDYERMSKDMEELQEALNRSQTFISTITKAVDPNKLLVGI